MRPPRGGLFNYPMNHRPSVTMKHTPALVSRRHFLHTAGLGIMGWPLAGALLSGVKDAVAQSVAATPTGLPPLNRFPRMMQDWLVDQLREAEARGNSLREAVKTKAEAEAYV